MTPLCANHAVPCDAINKPHAILHRGTMTRNMSNTSPVKNSLTKSGAKRPDTPARSKASIVKIPSAKEFSAIQSAPSDAKSQNGERKQNPPCTATWILIL